MKKIKAISYERIEQKNEIERELFSRLTKEEKRTMKASWFRSLDMFSKGGSNKK
jgi:hypothetical protein